MGLFGRKQADRPYLSKREVQSLTEGFLRSAEVTGVDMGGQMAGAAFRSAVHNGLMPPPGWTFTNRFLFGNPGEWRDLTAKAVDQAADETGVQRACSALLDLLEHYTLVGATTPEWMASEESVTVTLTVLCLFMADSICARHYEAVIAKWGGDENLHEDNELAWYPRMATSEWVVAHEIRERMHMVEGTFAFRSPSPPPAEVVWMVIAALRASSEAIEARIDEGPPFTHRATD